MELQLTASVQELPGVGQSSATLLKKLGIETTKELLYYFPTRYDDLRRQVKIDQLIPGERVSLEASVWQIKTSKTFRGKFLTTATLADETGTIEATWFNQPYLATTLRKELKITIAGKPGFYRGRLAFLAPSFETGSHRLHTARLVPVYPETAGLTSKWLRSKIKFTLEALQGKFKESLPEPILEKEGFPPLEIALQQMHFPSTPEEAEKARGRFAFEELFFLQLASLKRKATQATITVPKKVRVDKETLSKFVGQLPFTLTKAQTKAVNEIARDLTKTTPMNRLLQGDVGSGKTIVAAIAAYIVQQNGLKTLFMAPTEILALQHYEVVKRFFAHLQLSIGLATASKKVDLGSDLIVGTHALLNLAIPRETIGLIIVDEQHRFGVEQRGQLRSKGHYPHLLSLSATPIPRSLALIFFGELDISVIDTLPPGRKIAKTVLVTPEKRSRAYDFIKKHVASGEQVFIICPFIEPSETLQSVKSVKKEWEYLAKEIFPDYKLGLLHGRMKSKEKEKILADFKKGRFKILVTTPIVEVGIDISKATIILIEAAERFGLASLHQLRGRVGRGVSQSYCLIFSESADPAVIRRLKNMERLTNGFDLAEADLKYRGPGEIFGTAQHGLPTLKIASLLDQKLIQKTHQAASEILEIDPHLTKYRFLNTAVAKRNQEGLD